MRPGSRAITLTQIVPHGLQPRPESSPVLLDGELADASAHECRIGQITPQQSGDEFQVFESARGQFAHDQVMSLQTKGGDPAGTQRLQPSVPAHRQTRNLRGHDIRVEPVASSEGRAPPQLGMDQVGRLRVVPGIKVALLREQYFRGRPTAPGMDGL